MDSSNFDILSLLQGFRDGRVYYRADDENPDALVYGLVDADSETGAQEGAHADSIGMPAGGFDERTRIAG